METHSSSQGAAGKIMKREMLTESSSWKDVARLNNEREMLTESSSWKHIARLKEQQVR